MPVKILPLLIIGLFLLGPFMRVVSASSSLAPQLPRLDQPSIHPNVSSGTSRPFQAFANGTQIGNQTWHPRPSPFGRNWNQSNPNRIAGLATTYQHNFVIDYWGSPYGTVAFSGTFVAVTNTVSGFKDSNEFLAALPLNVAYGTSTSFVWFQLGILFESSGVTEILLEDNQAPNVISSTNCNMQQQNYINNWVSNTVPYVSGHKYRFALYPSGGNNIHFEFTDTSSNPPLNYRNDFTVPSTSVQSNQDCFSPASAAETFIQTGSGGFGNIPYFQFTVINNLGSDNNHYTAQAPTWPLNTYQIQTATDGTWHWAMLGSLAQVPAPSVNYPIVYPSSITLGQTAEIDVWTKNLYIQSPGTSASWQTINIAFPDNPPVSSISIGSGTDSALTSKKYGPTDPVNTYYGDGGPPVAVGYPIVEGSVNNWPVGVQHGPLQVFVTPSSIGNFRFRVKSVSAAVACCASDWDPQRPTSSGTNIVVDGQHEYADEFTIVVNPSTYSVTFAESPIPSGTSWGVTVGGTPHSTSSGTSISVSGLSGTVSYTYNSPVAGSGGSYTCTSSNCSGQVSGAGTVTATYTFQANTYSVTFAESPIPSGTSWGVTVGGTPHSTSSGTSISVSGLSGTVSYTYNSPVAGSGGSYTCTSSNCSGQVSGAGTVTATYTFTQTEQISVSTDKTSYAQGESVEYTASGFIPGDAVVSCLTTSDVAYNGLCLGQANADSNGKSVGSMFVGTNIPVGPQMFWVQDNSKNPPVASNLVQLTITSATVPMIVSYTIVGGASPTAPVFHYIQTGASNTFTLTSAPTTIQVDSGSSWSVTPIPGSSTEQWQSNQALSGTASSSVTIVFTFYHQYLLTVSYSIVGGGTGYSAPTFTANSYGVSAPQTMTGTPTGYWYDSGSSWSVTNPLIGSTGSEGWSLSLFYSLGPSGTVSSAGPMNFAYYHQYLLTLSYSVVGGGVGYSAPMFSARYLGSGIAGHRILTISPTDYWFDAGVQWSVDNPLGGSSTSEQWVTSQASGTVSSLQTITFAYQHQYYLTTQVNPSGTGSVTPSSGWQNAGSTVPILSTANPGYSFYYWSLDGANVDGLSSISMNSPHTLTVFFRGTSSISLQISVGSIPLGGSVTLSGTITPLQPTPGIPTGTTVIISYSLDAGTTWNVFITAQTGGGGSYSVTWTPPYSGNCQLSASWSGNSNYAGALSPVSSLSVTGSRPPQIMLLVSGPSSVARGGSTTFDILVTNPGASTTLTVYLDIIGPGGYEYFDTLHISVSLNSNGRYQFIWAVPSSLQAGSYQVSVGLIPPTASSVSQTQITVT